MPLLIRGARGLARRTSGRDAGQPEEDYRATPVDLPEPGKSPFPGQSLARIWEGSQDPGRSTELILSEIDSLLALRRPQPGRSPAARGPMTSRR